jgi:DNA-binding GntR family transcriptional regulator
VPVQLTYRQIADDLTDRIRRGEYPPGSELPSYNALADLYSVSYSTAARAYALLRDRRTVVGSPGRSVRVADRPNL